MLPKQDDFLYARKGPWPQPNPAFPMAEAPAVLNPTDDENTDWDLHIGSRYLLSLLTSSPGALLKSVLNSSLDPITDDDLNRLLCTSVYSRALTPRLDKVDNAFFAEYLEKAGPDTLFFKIDYTPMEAIRPYDGMYVTSTVTLVRQDGPSGPKRVVATRINDLLLTPEDGAAWELARYFILQGAAYNTLLTQHPNIHFPYDAINAITKSAVPKDHLLFRLLYPHFRFSLPLDNAVLESMGSVINESRWAPYDPFTARRDDGLLTQLNAGYSGIPGNSAYPPYSFEQQPEKIYSDYGDFLEAYYAPIFKFTQDMARIILRGEPQELKQVSLWARYIHQWIPGFPDERQILEGDILARTLATIIFDVSVAHAADHYAFAHDVGVRKYCLRLRLPPPASKNMRSFDRTKLSTASDIFRAQLANELFFKPSAVTLLIDTRYDFDTPELVALNTRFLQDLRETAAGLPANNYIPLDQITRSIQY
jgi:hypothetical protein